MGDIKQFDDLGRPSWNTYFIALAFLVSQRSIDKVTKHGTVVTSRDNTILSVGYNGPPRGCIDQNIPLSRPEKYAWLVHSEEAAVTNAARTGISLKNSIFYVTGHPCSTCMRKIINVGANKVVYSQVDYFQSDDQKKIVREMLIGQNIEMVEFKNISFITEMFEKLVEGLPRGG